jgi:hypothetical protein
VISGPFLKNLLHNHFITEFFKKTKSGEAKDSVIFPFFILLHKRAKPIHLSQFLLALGFVVKMGFVVKIMGF